MNRRREPKPLVWDDETLDSTMRLSEILMRRDIEPDDVRARCSGFGVIAYGSTATWRGGAGGQMVTSGVCDHCWGSGSHSKPWLNLRTLPRQ